MDPMLWNRKKRNLGNIIEFLNIYKSESTNESIKSYQIPIESPWNLRLHQGFFFQLGLHRWQGRCKHRPTRACWVIAAMKSPQLRAPMKSGNPGLGSKGADPVSVMWNEPKRLTYVSFVLVFCWSSHVWEASGNQTWQWKMTGNVKICI